jgi:HSP20 family protein
MFFATTAPATLRRPAYANAGNTVERFLNEALQSARHQSASQSACQSAAQSASYTQDETAYTLALDVPGIAKDQLSIAIEGAVVRISSKEGAPRRYQAAYEFPQEVDSSASEARLEHGVLHLKLVKKVPVNNATELTIL